MKNNPGISEPSTNTKTVTREEHNSQKAEYKTYKVDVYTFKDTHTLQTVHVRIHVYNTCPYPCVQSMSVSMCTIHVRIHVYNTCPYPCVQYMSVSMGTIHVRIHVYNT